MFWVFLALTVFLKTTTSSAASVVVEADVHSAPCSISQQAK
jgi:hypothetical protein